MNICTQCRLPRAPGLQFFRPFQFRDVRRDATNRVRLRCAVPQQEFDNHVLSFALRHRHGFLKLDRCAGSDDMPIVCPHLFGHIRRMNVKVGFPADLVHAAPGGGVHIRGSPKCSAVRDP